jgi:hypothetical protein
MSKIVGFLARTEPGVLQMATLLGAIVGEPVEWVHISSPDRPAIPNHELVAPEGQVLRRLAGPLLTTVQGVVGEGVTAAVFGLRQRRRGGAPSALLTAVLAWSPTPIVVVPDTAVVPQLDALRRVLVPLDRASDTGSAVSAARALAGDVAEVVPLHVFDQSTVPTFWDQPQHEATVWGYEFARRAAVNGAEVLELRAGDAGAAVLDAATTRRADLVVLAWSQKFEPGRAKVVREVLANAHIPVVLLPRGP